MLILKSETPKETAECALPTGSASLDPSISLVEEVNIQAAKAEASQLKEELNYSTIKTDEVSSLNLNQNTLLDEGMTLL